MKEGQQHRREWYGNVVSNKMDKTVVVAVERSVIHPVYKKVLRRLLKSHCLFSLCLPVPFEEARRSKFSQLMANHIFSDEYGNELLAVVHRECMPDHIRHHR